MPSAYRFVVADVFTDTPLAGNQLAVFTDARDLTTERMQALALEIGFSETVFVLPPEEGGTVRIRIFDPREEMPFAGHPVLGAAFVLAAPLQLGVIVLETGAGPVPVTLERDGSGRLVFGRMRQPTPVVTPFARAEELLAALGVAESRLPVEHYDNGARHVIVTLASEAAVSALAPVPSVIAGFGLTGVNCIAGGGASWRNRMFWAHGEDAATGSAVGPIACHLARHGLVGWGDEVTVLQGVELGRPSTLVARADGADGRIDAVEVGGSAVVVARGEFRV